MLQSDSAAVADGTENPISNTSSTVGWRSCWCSLHRKHHFQWYFHWGRGVSCSIVARLFIVPLPSNGCLFRSPCHNIKTFYNIRNRWILFFLFNIIFRVTFVDIYYSLICFTPSPLWCQIEIYSCFVYYLSESLEFEVHDIFLLYVLHIVTRLLKRCPLHGNGSINKQAVTRQQLATTIKELLGAVFSVWSVLRLYRESRWGSSASCHRSSWQPVIAIQGYKLPSVVADSQPASEWVDSDG
jgi:hypothetical protein